VASLGGEAGLKDLAAAMQGRSAIEVVDELFLD
jgi:hypothetical protein